MPDQQQIPAQYATILALVDAQASARDRLRGNLITRLVALWRTLTGDAWYDDGQVRAVARQAADLVRRAQVATGDLTEAYLDRAAAEMGSTLGRGGVSLPARLRDVDPLTEWQRPAKDFRRVAADGAVAEQATRRAELRVVQLASTDVDLSMREAARQRLAPASKVVGYRRVIHPELSRSGTCGLCIAAADHVYKRGDLLPIHGNCRCEVLPIIKGKADPGQIFNGVDTTQLYREVTAAAGAPAADKLKNTRVTVTAHGELGPVLHDASHRFRHATAATDDLRDAASA